MGYKETDCPNLNIDEIVENRAYYDEDEPDVIYVECSPKFEYDGGCPECGGMEIVGYGHGETRRIHDTSIGTKSIDIMLNTQRYKCKYCGKVFRHPITFADSNRWITNRLETVIRKRSLSEPFKNVADEFGITITTVSSIFEEYGKELEKGRKLVAPRVLGIDENHLNHVMCGIFTDIENGTLLEITKDNKMPTIQAAIESMIDYDKNIEIVTMDMYRGYKSVVEMCLPNAKIIVDKFHVVRYIYKAAETARKQIFEKLKQDVASMPNGPKKDDKERLLTRLGKDGYLFKFSSKRVSLDPSRASLMASLCATFPELNELRILKLRAEKIYDESKDQFEAATNINDFISNIPNRPEFKDFKALAKTFNNWMPEILNYFKYGRYTNATTEGLNSLIKQLSGMGRGYSFNNLRTKALYWPKAHNKPTLKARKKPSVSSPDTIQFMTFFTGNEYLSGDCSDIDVLNQYFDQIF